jgi:phosphoglycerate dehydrogenase-like enzyme
LRGTWLERIRASCQSWATVESAPEKSLAGREQVLASDVVVGWPDAEPVVTGKARFFQCGSTGYEAYVGKGLEQKKNFVMTNAAGTMSIPVAEHGIAMMMAGARNLWRHAQDQPHRRFERQTIYREIAGSTACICGLGSIGTEIARRCVGLGLHVVGVRRDLARTHPIVRDIFPLSRLAEAVSAADHVFIALPLSAATRGLFNATLFSAMKRGAALYSLARGAHIVDEDLLAALHSGQVGLAGLDVFASEPLPPESPWWSAPNTMITPHCSGRSEHEFRRMAELVMENLAQFHAGGELRNVVMKNGE